MAVLGGGRRHKFVCIRFVSISRDASNYNVHDKISLTVNTVDTGLVLKGWLLSDKNTKKKTQKMKKKGSNKKCLSILFNSLSFEYRINTIYYKFFLMVATIQSRYSDTRVYTFGRPSDLQPLAPQDVAPARSHVCSPCLRHDSGPPESPCTYSQRITYWKANCVKKRIWFGNLYIYRFCLR